MANETEAQTTPGGKKRRVLSAMQPTSESLHLGNYLGALAQWVSMQETHEALYCVADLHSITAGHDPKKLAEQTRVTAAQYIAAGVDPERSLLFVQSHVAQHAELGWVLGCLTGFGEASRMTQFKDKSGSVGDQSVTVGLFTYPVLMAADILLYRAHEVPVGDDQKQHLELTRDLAERFNKRFGKTFVVPEPTIRKETARIMDLQEPTAKMSKSASSAAGLLEIMAEPSVVRKRIKSAVTDTEREIRFDAENKPGVANLLSIHAAVSGQTIPALESAYEGKGYGDLKGDVADLVVELLTPIRDRALELVADPAQLDVMLADGAAKAVEIAGSVMTQVYDKVGFVPRAR